MFDGMSKATLVVAALIGGLALFVAGFIIAAEMRSAAASPAAATTGGGCYTNWNANTCAAGWTAVYTGVWDAVAWSGEGQLLCGPQLTPNYSSGMVLVVDSVGSDGEAHAPTNLPCALCCASGGAVVGGVADMPNVAGTGDSLPRNQIIIAAVTALVAFTAGGWYARRRWSR